MDHSTDVAPSESRPEASAAGQITTALRALLAAAPAVQAAMGRRLGVPPADVAAIDRVVGSDAPIGPAELGRRLGITSASATIMVDRLEGTGHLVRTRHPGDRRRVTLIATESGRHEIRAALSPLVGSIDRLVAELSVDEAETVAGFLREAIAAMHDYAGQPGAPTDASGG